MDMIGKTFGILIVLSREDNDKCGQLRWLCLCRCSQKKTIYGKHLRSGHTRSCGCLAKNNSTRHKHSKGGKSSKTYTSWNLMVRRCVNPNNPSYNNYGGRGISVCRRWRKFDNFLEDMGVRPDGQQIDRIDNNGNYCKSNCRWVTSQQNNRNRRNNHIITFRGKTQCVTAWAEETGIKCGTIYYRIKHGWSIKHTLTKPTNTAR